MKLVTHFFLFLFLFVISSANGLKITTRLIHRDSIFSPHFNASLTTTDLASRMVGASLARHSASVLVRTSDDEGGELASITPPLIWVENKIHVVFYVNFSIGDPPVPQLAVLDTGSSLLWVRCPPCTHCSSITGATYFYPSNSKTYSPLPCTNDYCTKCTPGRWPWSAGKECMFRIEYPDLQSIGVYAYDQMTFRTNDNDKNTTTVPGVLFGCSQTEIGRDYVDLYANGIMGLGKGFDSGTELTLLRPEAYDAVKAEVRSEAKLLDLREVRSPVKNLELCFRGTIDEEGNAFNNFGFHFDEGAELMVDNFGMFWQVSDDIFCLAITRSKDFNIVGMIAQQGYNVGYDMDRSTNLLYFQKVDCEELVDF
ncbi:Probable aspartic protease At2g35615 [Linum grandiflorum]